MRETCSTASHGLKTRATLVSTRARLLRIRARLLSASGTLSRTCGNPRTGLGRGTAIVVMLMGSIALPWQAAAQLDKRYELADLRALEAAFVKLAEDVQPSVVAIRTYYVRQQKMPDGRESPPQAGSRRVAIPISQGSGFVLDTDGHIVTNRHVLEDANTFSIIVHTGQRFDATVCQTDQRTDLAVLKIDAEDLVPVRLGDLTDVKINQWTFACGNPFGLANLDGQVSVTYGVVSALGRQMTDALASDRLLQYFGNLIETSSTINPGSSGGPLFNINGEVIGVVTALASSSGVSEGHGYAIPIDKDIRRVLETLKKGELFSYGYMGIQVDDVEPPRSRRVAHSRSHHGARIVPVNLPNGPAAKAGLKKNDIVIAVNGIPVEGSDHLVRLVQFSPVGSKIEITYLRRNVKRKTTVTLADRNEMLGLARPR